MATEAKAQEIFYLHFCNHYLCLAKGSKSLTAYNLEPLLRSSQENKQKKVETEIILLFWLLHFRVIFHEKNNKENKGNFTLRQWLQRLTAVSFHMLF